MVGSPSPYMSTFPLSSTHIPCVSPFKRAQSCLLLPFRSIHQSIPSPISPQTIPYLLPNPQSSIPQLNPSPQSPTPSKSQANIPPHSILLLHRLGRPPHRPSSLAQAAADPRPQRRRRPLAVPRPPDRDLRRARRRDARPLDPHHDHGQGEGDGLEGAREQRRGAAGDGAGDGGDGHGSSCLGWLGV